MVIFVALVVTATGYADMLPVSGVDVGRGGVLSASSPSVLPSTDSPSLLGSPSIADLNPWSVKFLPGANADAEQASATPHSLVATNGPDSLALCLSALMGLGLCSSVHWIKRLSFGFIPEWYHNGGPFQIGHSHAVNPDTLCSIPAYCFIQPAYRALSLSAQYREGTFISLWRKSQCTARVLGSRAPPAMS